MQQAPAFVLRQVGKSNFKISDAGAAQTAGHSRRNLADQKAHADRGASR